MRVLSSGAMFGALLVLVGAVACGSSTKVTYVDEPIPDDGQDGGGGATPSPDSGLGILSFRPDKSFSGFDGTHTFKVPVAVYDSGSDLTVTVSDTSAATVAPVTLVKPQRNDGTTDNGKYFMVTIKKAGTFTLTAKSGGNSVESTITVASYAAGRWAAGEARYLNGGGEPACKDCHVDGEAIDHSPAALASVTDEKLQAVITTGISTGGFPIKINGTPGHKWTTTPDELSGLVTYLRGLEPRGFN